MTIAQDLTAETCCVCGVAFAIPSEMVRRLKETGNSFHCPNGHGQHFGSEIERLKKQLEQKDAALFAARTQIALERDQKEASESRLAKLKKRVGNGVCPCCNRSFTNLHRHITTKHPDFK